MTANVAEQIDVYFDLTAVGGDFFTLDDAVKGKLDDATYLLAGPVATDISAYVIGYSLTRGRSRELDEIQAGTLNLQLNNYDGRFLPDAFTGTVGPYGADNIVPGKRVTVMTAGQAIFDGIIEDWSLTYSADRTVSVSATAVDALAQLGRRNFNAWTATASQTAGPRLTAILDRSEVAWTPNRSIDTGVSSLLGDSVSYGSNVLNYCQLVVKSDLGRLFASREGVLTFRDRHAPVAPTSTLTFDDAGAGIPFVSAELVYGDTLLYTDVSVDREGGTAQTATNTAARALYGIRRLDIGGLLLDSDVQSLDQASWLNGIYSTPQPRINSLIVNLDRLSTADQAAVCSLDLASVVSVSWTPRGGTAIVADYVVEGLAHSADALGVHEVAVQLSPVFAGEALILDNSILGKLDSGVLAY